MKRLVINFSVYMIAVNLILYPLLKLVMLLHIPSESRSIEVMAVGPWPLSVMPIWSLIVSVVLGYGILAAHSSWEGARKEAT